MQAVLLIAALGAVYALVYYLNQKTAVPEGCEDPSASCASCSVGTCSVKPLITKEKHV